MNVVCRGVYKFIITRTIFSFEYIGWLPCLIWTNLIIYTSASFIHCPTCNDNMFFVSSMRVNEAKSSVTWISGVLVDGCVCRAQQEENSGIQDRLSRTFTTLLAKAEVWLSAVLVSCLQYIPCVPEMDSRFLSILTD